MKIKRLPFLLRLGLVLTAGICEEFLFRGYAIERFTALTGKLWIGAVAAMATKGALAASVGAGIRPWIIAHIPPRTIRYIGVSALLLLGLLSVLETLTEAHA